MFTNDMKYIDTVLALPFLAVIYAGAIWLTVNIIRDLF